ncbi:MAG TPA: NADH-quinone oxidoreductase subunit J [Bacteroidetes bacterium]|nr:NADH-quinone oxidoreductase subunit J [Bacteroidota bacterium]
MVQDILFYLFSGIAIVSAVAMVLHKNPVYSVLLLILTLFSLAGLYVLLEAPFIAAVHIIVYAGAIVVLFLFVIMLLDMKKDLEPVRWRRLSRILAACAGLAFLIEAGLVVLSMREQALMAESGDFAGSVEQVGLLLFTRYLLPFEIASILLLVAIIGVVVLARRKPLVQG